MSAEIDIAATESKAPATARAESTDFSLVVGGPFYQLWRQSRIAGDALQLVHRRVIVLAAITWLPLLILSVVEGKTWGGVTLPFFKDIETHVRFLIALPLLVFAEIVVHRRMRPVVGQFLVRGLIPDAARARFEAAITSAVRLRNSLFAEALLVGVVYVVGVLIVWRTQLAMGVGTWYGDTVDGKLQPSLAGWWLGCVSLPLFQFLLLRWYFRLFIWARFLWHVSRIELGLMPMNPDRAGGLGFLATMSQAFAPVLVAQGAVLSGFMANRIFYAGTKLPHFKLQLIGLVTVMVFAILGPLLVFLPQLAAARRKGMREYGNLGQQYAREFDDKWLRGGAPPGEAFIGSADIQSLADLGNSYEVVRDMKVAPFTMRTVFHLGVVSLLPVTPLLLTMFPLDELLENLFKMIF